MRAMHIECVDRTAPVVLVGVDASSWIDPQFMTDQQLPARVSWRHSGFIERH